MCMFCIKNSLTVNGKSISCIAVVLLLMLFSVSYEHSMNLCIVYIYLITNSGL